MLGQPLGQQDAQIRIVSGLESDAETGQNKLKEIVDIQMGIKNKCHGYILLAQRREQMIDQAGLACARFTRQNDQALAALRSDRKLVQCALDTCAEVEIAWIRVGSERIFMQPEKTEKGLISRLVLVPPRSTRAFHLALPLIL